MKRPYFLLAAVLFSALCFAQTEGASKVYGYKQRVMPGMARVDKSGREIPPRTNYNYFIYLASTTRVTPVEIWVHGEAYSPLVSKIPSTPVEYTNPTSGDNVPQILVPKMKRNVLQLSPSPDKIERATAKGKALSAKNELVIIYKGNGKLYYKTVSKLKELIPLSMQ